MEKIKIYESRTLTHVVGNVYFDAADHKYFHFIGDTAGLLEIPGVSKVLEESGIKDMGRVPRRIMEKAMQRGTDVHHACYLDDQGKLDESSIGDIMGYVKAYRKWKKAEQPVFVAREEPMYDQVYDVCGIVDIVAKLPKCGNPRRDDVIDIKSGYEYGWHVYQVAGYCIMRWGKAWLKHGLWGLYLRADETYTFKRVPIAEHMRSAGEWVRMVKAYNDKRHDLFVRGK